MRTYTITLNGIEKKTEIATSWDDVTYRQFRELDSIEDDPVHIISFFSGVDKPTLMKAKITNLGQLLNDLEFMKQEIPKSLPTSILGYDVPKDLEFSTLAQYEDVRTTVKDLEGKDKKDILDSYPLLCGTYAMNPYDPNKVDKFSEQFNEAPCGEVLAIGNFTLQKFLELKLKSNQISPLGDTHLKRLKLAFRSWLRNLAFTARYSWLKRKHRIEETNS